MISYFWTCVAIAAGGFYIRELERRRKAEVKVTQLEFIIEELVKHNTKHIRNNSAILTKLQETQSKLELTEGKNNG